MALSKGLRLLWKQEPAPSALLEARSRQDCLLLEAGTVAALSKCLRGGRGGRGCPGVRTSAVRGPRGATAQEHWGTALCGVGRGRGARRATSSRMLAAGSASPRSQPDLQHGPPGSGTCWSIWVTPGPCRARRVGQHLLLIRVPALLGVASASSPAAGVKKKSGRAPPGARWRGGLGTFNVQDLPSYSLDCRERPG